MSEIQNQEPDLLTRFKNNELDLDNLSPSDTDLLAKQLEALDTSVEESTQAEQRFTEDKPEEDYTQKEKSESKEKKSLKDQYIEKANDANRYYQMHQTAIEKQNKHERLLKTDPSYRKQYFESLGIPLPETGTPKPQFQSSKPSEVSEEDDDIYSEEYLKKIKLLEREQAELKNEIKKLIGSKEQEDQFQSEQNRMNKELMQIEDLQREYSNLKTSKPFKELDKEYSAWYSSLGKENVSRYFSDPEYKAQLDKAGRGVFPEFEKYETLVKTYNKYQDGKYPSVRAAFRDSEYLDKLSLQQSSPSYYDATEQVARKMADKANEPKVMDSTSSGQHYEGEGMTEQFMMSWLNQNPNPELYTVKQMEIYDKIAQKLGIK